MDYRLRVACVTVPFLWCSTAVAGDATLGQRIRITLAPGGDLPGATAAEAEERGLSCHRIDGTLVEIRRDGSLVVRLLKNDARVVVPDAAIRIVDVRRQRSAGSGAFRGAAFGLLIGGGAGALAGAAPSHCDSNGSSWSFCFPTRDRVILGSVAWGLVGTAAGAIIGAVSPGGSWEYAPGFGTTRKAVRLSVTPVRGRGAALTVAVRL
jgi:hypothetical protein